MRDKEKVRRIEAAKADDKNANAGAKEEQEKRRSVIARIRTTLGMGKILR